MCSFFVSILFVFGSFVSAVGHCGRRVLRNDKRFSRHATTRKTHGGRVRTAGDIDSCVSNRSSTHGRRRSWFQRRPLDGGREGKRTFFLSKKAKNEPFFVSFSQKVFHTIFAVCQSSIVQLFCRQRPFIDRIFTFFHCSPHFYYGLAITQFSFSITRRQ